jgi:ketosteroid isomerase-like protein
MRKLMLAAMAWLVVSSGAVAQTTTPADDPVLGAIKVLRTDLIDSFNKGDVERLLSHLDGDVVVTWQNGEVCRGPDAVKAYYNKMMTGPDRVVRSASAEPSVADRHVYAGDWAVSWGKMNDHFILQDGTDLAMDSRFTATLIRRGGEWKIAAFHVSTNTFDNAVLSMATKKVALWTGLVALGVGVAVGAVVGRLSRRKAEA